MTKEYRVNPEAREVATKLVEKFPETLGEIDVSKIFFVHASGGKKHVATIRAVRPPFSLLTDMKYIVTTYEKTYSGKTKEQQIVTILHELMHIDNFQEGKLKNHSVEDFVELLKTYGIEWSHDNKLSNPLDTSKLKEAEFEIKKETDDKEDELEDL